MTYRGDPEWWKVSIALIKERIDLENAKALDIGFGSGGFLLALAQESKTVIGVDISLAVIKKMESRPEFKKMDNLHLLYESAVSLPFGENSFDLIILNGVLEYTARGQKGSPRDTHLKVLKDIRKMLKPGGLFYFGIENRYYLKFLLGWRDHFEMRWSNSLPRKLSTFISKHLLGEEVRHWIYSYNETLELLGEAGFNTPMFYSALPNYKSPEYIIPLEDLEEVQRVVMSTHTKKLYKDFCYLLAKSSYLYKKIGPDWVILSEVK